MKALVVPLLTATLLSGNRVCEGDSEEGGWVGGWGVIGRKGRLMCLGLATIYTIHRSSSCYSQDQGLQCYWRTGHFK